MRATFLLLAAAVLLAWGAGLSGADEPAPLAPNLVFNPDLEEGIDGEPAGWRWTTAVPDNFEVAWTDEGRTGKGLYLKSHSAVMSGYWNQSVRVEPLTSYVFSGWFRLGGGRLLCYAHARTADGRNVDERFYAASMRNHFLVPVFLRPEYMAGYGADEWHPFSVPFTTLEGMEWITVSMGMYFHAGEAWFDDVAVRPAVVSETKEENQ